MGSLGLPARSNPQNLETARTMEGAVVGEKTNLKVI